MQAEARLLSGTPLSRIEYGNYRLPHVLVQSSITQAKAKRQPELAAKPSDGRTSSATTIFEVKPAR